MASTPTLLDPDVPLPVTLERRAKTWAGRYLGQLRGRPDTRTTAPPRHERSEKPSAGAPEGRRRQKARGRGTRARGEAFDLKDARARGGGVIYTTMWLLMASMTRRLA